jgi:hypothetical protein
VADLFPEKTMADLSVAKRLASLPELAKPELCELWRKLFNKEPPDIRKELMIRVVAYRLQEQEFGELSNATSRRLRQLAKTFEADPGAVGSTRPQVKPGTRLVRQWKGQVHVVEVEPDGYAYRGSCYENLSEIARLITGTRWSGPLFFGLRAGHSKKPTEIQ